MDKFRYMYFKIIHNVICRAIFKLRQYWSNFYNITIQDRFEMFDKLIFLVLNYGSEILGLQSNIKIERIHLNYSKVL